MIGWEFHKVIEDQNKDGFTKLLDVFKELLIHTSGNVSDALSWLTQLDRTYNISGQNISIGEFIERLKEEGYLKEQKGKDLGTIPTSKMEIALRKYALQQIFSELNKTKLGNHSNKHIGYSDETTSETRAYQYGDKLDKIAISETLKNAQQNHGIEEFRLTHEDLIIHETTAQSQTSTVLMIDISHSMILYGEDRITPAKKVAMALSEMITTQYPKDTLDIIVFGNDAWEVTIKDLPYLEVGPYHTNTVAGLELAIEILRKKKTNNKQIMMITDGKPTCIKKGEKYIKNPYGLDREIVNRTLTLAIKCRKLGIPITTFMIARDNYLMQFVDAFTAANNGKAFYSSLENLGEFIFLDYKRNQRKGKNI